MSELTDDQKFRNAIEAAWQDSDFKTRLTADPAETLREFGIECSKGCKITIIESDETNRFFVLPPAPDSNLSLEEFKAKSDGSDYRALVHVLHNVNCC